MQRWLVAASLGLWVGIAAADAPIPPGEAAGKMTVPEGFHVTLFAGEPDVVQPIACTFDDRGRLWVVECLSYPKWTEDGSGRDRVVIFEDTNGDGQHDRRTVFYDRGVNLSGIEYGFGGVWLTSIPNLIFIPDRNGDDRPDGPPEIVLDGWDLKAKHNVVNSLGWGPDGWLYGCNGILSNSTIGRPGTPEAQRVNMNCGVWRFHPLRRDFEAVAWGTTNPWGLDWDDYGQAFITNCVIKHLFHVMPGAHYERMFGQDLNPHVYDLLPSCADHRHWAGGPWESSRNAVGAHSDFGGGHAHSGCAVYLGDNFPPEYRNNVFMCNIHGNRVNRDTLEIEGSSYVAYHAPDFLHAHDPWFRGLAVKTGPEGGLYVTDWTDTGECHNYEVADITNGRIYRVTFGKPEIAGFNLATKTDAELVALQSHRNDWPVRHARRLLQERFAAGKLHPDAPQWLQKQLDDAGDTPQRLRAQWALHAIGQTTPQRVAGWLRKSDEHVQGWAATLAAETLPASASQTDTFAKLALNTPSLFVRRNLASVAHRYSHAGKLSDATAILLALASRADETEDPVLTAMIWYAAEPIVDADLDRALQLLMTSRQSLVRQSIARKCADTGTLENRRLNRVLQLVQGNTRQPWKHDVVRGILAAYTGLSHVDPPPSWPAAHAGLQIAWKLYMADQRENALQPESDPKPSADLLADVQQLAVLFGDQSTLGDLRKTLSRGDASVTDRRRALELLHTQHPVDLPPHLIAALDEPELRPLAIRMLAAYADPSIARVLLKRYQMLSPAERQDIIQTLASRPAFAIMLLDAVANKAIPRSDVSALIVRQLQSLKSPLVDAKLKDVWGEIRPASAAKQQLAERYRRQLAPAVLAGANLTRGQAVYSQTCGQCHKLFGQGGGIGPELTGSQRANLDYLLDNVLDPSAIVPFDYRVTMLQMADGRVLQGIVAAETAINLTLQTINQRLTVAKSDIEDRQQSRVSMMPEGLFDRLSDQDLRDLVGYLQTSTAPE